MITNLLPCFVPRSSLLPTAHPHINGSGEEGAVTRDLGGGCGYKGGPGLLWASRCCAVQLYVNLTQARVIRLEGTSREKMSPEDLAAGKPVGHLLSD